MRKRITWGKLKAEVESRLSDLGVIKPDDVEVAWVDIHGWSDIGVRLDDEKNNGLVVSTSAPRWDSE